MKTSDLSATPDSPHSGDWFAKPSSIWITGIALFILLSGTTIFLGFRHLEAARNHARVADNTSANLLADVIMENNKATIGILQSYAHRPLFVNAVKNKDVAGVHRHLSDLKKNAEIDLTFVTDKRGVLWANFPVFPEAIGKNLSSRDWYRGTSASWKPYISRVFQLIVGDKPLAAAICVPVIDEKEMVIGILATSQRLGYIGDIVQRVPLSPHTGVTVIDRAGQILYSNTFSYRDSIKDYPFFPAIETALKEKKQQIEIKNPQDNSEKINLFIVPVGITGWSVIVGRTQSDILRSEFNRFIEMGAVSFLIFLLIIALLIYLRKVALFRKTEELLKTEAKLRESELQYRLLFENMLAGFAYYQIIFAGGRAQDLLYLDVNNAFKQLTGLEDVVGRKITEVIPGIKESNPELLEIYGRVALTGKPEKFENYFEPLKAWLSISVYSPVRGYCVAVFDNITERKQAEEKIKASLLEKELLLKEIHHRVKNNLQIIASLLNMQGRYTNDQKLEGIFGECQDRIRAMASVHALLYKSQNMAEIDFGEYIRETTGQLFRSYRKNNAKISLVIHAENVMLSIDEAIPCGLIINELVTNALKYAFPEATQGELKIEMSETEQGIRLLFKDDGIGFPQDLDFRNAKTMGLKLVNMLVKQLDGSIEQIINNGTTYVISFTTKSI